MIQSELEELENRLSADDSRTFGLRGGQIMALGEGQMVDLRVVEPLYLGGAQKMIQSELEELENRLSADDSRTFGLRGGQLLALREGQMVDLRLEEPLYLGGDQKMIHTSSLSSFIGFQPMTRELLASEEAKNRPKGR